MTYCLQCLDNLFIHLEPSHILLLTTTISFNVFFILGERPTQCIIVLWKNWNSDARFSMFFQRKIEEKRVVCIFSL